MHLALTIIILLCAIGCSDPTSQQTDAPQIPRYEPSTFRAEVGRLVGERRYDAAIAYLQSADAERQAAFDKKGYFGVGEDMIVLPSVPSTVFFDASRDWLIPGTSDAIEHAGWQQVAKEFAKLYNQKRLANKPHAANSATTFLVSTLCHRRGVADAERYSDAEDATSLAKKVFETVKAG